MRPTAQPSSTRLPTARTRNSAGKTSVATLVALAVIVTNALADVTVAALDPRLRVST